MSPSATPPHKQTGFLQLVSAFMHTWNARRLLFPKLFSAYLQNRCESGIVLLVVRKLIDADDAKGNGKLVM